VRKLAFLVIEVCTAFGVDARVVVADHCVGLCWDLCGEYGEGRLRVGHFGDEEETPRIVVVLKS
jgi:hypothetical protein